MKTAILLTILISSSLYAQNPIPEDCSSANNWLKSNRKLSAQCIKTKLIYKEEKLISFVPYETEPDDVVWHFFAITQEKKGIFGLGKIETILVLQNKLKTACRNISLAPSLDSDRGDVLFKRILGRANLSINIDSTKIKWEEKRSSSDCQNGSISLDHITVSDSHESTETLLQYIKFSLSRNKYITREEEKLKLIVEEIDQLNKNNSPASGLKTKSTPDSVMDTARKNKLLELHDKKTKIEDFINTYNK